MSTSSPSSTKIKDIASKRAISSIERFKRPEYWTFDSAYATLGGTISTPDPVVLPPPPPNPIGATTSAVLTAPTLVVPVYGSLWNSTLVTQANRVISAKQAHPSVEMLAIINPNNGPGNAPLTSVTNFITAAQAAGVNVLGYVSTYYMHATDTTPTASPYTGILYTPTRIKADIAKYKQYYPTLDGIHYDELSGLSTKYNNYLDVTNYAKAAGFHTLFANPGGAMNSVYYDMFDTFEIYEGGSYPSIATIDARAYTATKGKFTVVVHSVGTYDGTFVVDSEAHAYGIYITHTADYGTISNYLEDLAATLDGL